MRKSKGDFLYNGHLLEDPDITTYGMGPLGVEYVAQKGFVCRGVLLDAVALRGGQLPIPKKTDPSDPGIIAVDDIKARRFKTSSLAARFQPTQRGKSGRSTLSMPPNGCRISGR